MYYYCNMKINNKILSVRCLATKRSPKWSSFALCQYLDGWPLIRGQNIKTISRWSMIRLQECRTLLRLYRHRLFAVSVCPRAIAIQRLREWKAKKGVEKRKNMEKGGKGVEIYIGRSLYRWKTRIMQKYAGICRNCNYYSHVNHSIPIYNYSYSFCAGNFQIKVRESEDNIFIIIIIIIIVVVAVFIPIIIIIVAIIIITIIIITVA